MSEHTPSSAETPPSPQPAVSAPRGSRKKLIIAVVVIVVLIAGVGYFISSMGKVSTDDAYVNGHVTFVAPRVAGQVSAVLVDDNNRVHKGDRLVLLDPQPYQVQVEIARSGVAAAQADLVAATAQTRANAAQARSLRFNLEHMIEETDNQVALLRAKVASLGSQKATLDRTKAEYDRIQSLVETKAISQQDIDTYKEAFLVAQAKYAEALQNIYQIRVGLGLPAKPESGDDLTQVPADLDQTASAVRQAQASLIEAAAKLGYIDSFTKTPKQMVADFYKLDPSGDINKIYAELMKTAPAVKQAEAKLAQAKRLLDQAELNLSYCTVVSEIDGVVTRRNVNPGNNVIAGQSLMAVRSVDDIWVDANFKETQLADLKIGQPVELETDMYGSHQTFKGRISGFTMGTGSTLALLPAENATGNFVKVVQRLPVRIDLIEYNPDKAALFIGLSVTATVHTSEQPTGDHAGSLLQAYLPAAAPATMPSMPTTGPAVAPETAP